MGVQSARSSPGGGAGRARGRTRPTTSSGVLQTGAQRSWHCLQKRLEPVRPSELLADPPPPVALVKLHARFTTFSIAARAPSAKRHSQVLRRRGLGGRANGSPPRHTRGPVGRCHARSKLPRVAQKQAFTGVLWH